MAHGLNNNPVLKQQQQQRAHGAGGARKQQQQQHTTAGTGCHRDNNGGKTGGGGMGSRRIFSPEFKLQVLKSYREDPDCKGNQRATARKYGIHRRQIQKWLQVEDSLRKAVLQNASKNGTRIGEGGPQNHQYREQQQQQQHQIIMHTSPSVSPTLNINNNNYNNSRRWDLKSERLDEQPPSSAGSPTIISYNNNNNNSDNVLWAPKIPASTLQVAPIITTTALQQVSQVSVSPPPCSRSPSPLDYTTTHRRVGCASPLVANIRTSSSPLAADRDPSAPIDLSLKSTSSCGSRLGARLSGPGAGGARGGDHNAIIAAGAPAAAPATAEQSRAAAAAATARLTPPPCHALSSPNGLPLGGGEAPASAGDVWDLSTTTTTSTSSRSNKKRKLSTSSSLSSSSSTTHNVMVDEESSRHTDKGSSPSSCSSPKPHKLFKPYLDDYYEGGCSSSIKSEHFEPRSPPLPPQPLCCGSQPYYYHLNNDNHHIAHFENNNIISYDVYTLHELQPKSPPNCCTAATCLYTSLPPPHVTGYGPSAEYETPSGATLPPCCQSARSFDDSCCGYMDNHHGNHNNNNNNNNSSMMVPVKQRHSYSLAFKLSAIECYHQDSLCKGNQRAVASRFNVHRRQVQKWLQQEQFLRHKSEIIKLHHRTAQHAVVR